ncbi:MAG: tetratricopeptide repeat protein [Acidobacteria bacterium]|nr:tetratricopeptide repeat protein [Acidobacteriota bacterium]
MRPIRLLIWVVLLAMPALPASLHAQTTLQYGVQYKCGERFTVFYCRSDDQSRDAFPVQPQDDYCKVEYPDRPSNPGFVYEGSELRGDLIKKLQACAAIKAAPPAAKAPPAKTQASPQPNTLATQATQAKSADAYLQEGNRYFQAKDFPNALQAFQKGLAAGGDRETRFALYRGLGHTYSMQGQAEKAVAAQSEAVKLNPRSSAAHVNLGAAYTAVHKSKEALAEFQQAVRLDPSDYVAYDWLAGAYDDLSRPEEAVAAWKKALAAKPQDAWFLVHIADSLQKKKAYDAAISAYQSAIQLKPAGDSMAHAQYALGLAYNESDKPALAVPPLLEAIRLKPNDQKAHYELGKAYLAVPRCPLALAEFRSAIRLDPKDSWSYIRLGEAYNCLNQRPQAIATWKQLLANTSKEKSPLIDVAGRLEYLKEYDLALTAYRMALDAPAGAAPEEQMNAPLRDSDAFSGMARIYFERKQYQELVKLAEWDPEQTYLYSHELGYAYIALHQLAKAVKVFEDAVELDEEKAAESLYDLGHCYNLMGRKPDARRIYTKLLAIEKKTASKLLAEIE